MQGVGGMGVRNLRTNLVIYDGIMDISCQAPKFICILNIVEKPRNFALLCQRF